MWRASDNQGGGGERSTSSANAAILQRGTSTEMPRRDYSMDIRRPAPAAISRVSKEVSRAQSMEYSAQVRQQLAGDMGGITGTPNCQGWLLKESKGMLMSKWQKRYFALYGQRLLYWVEEDDFRNKMPFKGYVSLDGCSITEGAQKGHRKYCIGIFHPQRRDYFLDSGSPKTMQKWVQKFEEALGLHRSQVTMSDFDVLSVVGKGAAGTVYQVREKESQDIFAMKVISKSAIQDRIKVAKPSPGLSKEESMEKHWMVQSVKMERKILEAVNHPFIVRLFFAFQTAEKLCFVLDFVNGGELYTHIAREKRFNEDRARFYAGEIILALEYLHEMGIVYRDLKPENILLDSEGHLKLTDFGQSKGGIEPGNVHGDNRRSFSLVGSPYYMAPEIFLKEGHGFEADWWSLGVLIYEMLVGLPPFYNENTSLAYRKLLVEEVQYPSHVSSEARKMLKALLQVNYKDRFGVVEPPGAWQHGEIERIKSKWNFAWLLPLDFKRLLEKQIKPPFTPSVSSSVDLSNISSQFTSVDIAGAAAEEAPSVDPFISLFGDFSFSSTDAAGNDNRDTLSVLLEGDYEDRSFHGSSYTPDRSHHSRGDRDFADSSMHSKTGSDADRSMH